MYDARMAQRSQRPRAAIAFKAHTGWAAALVVAEAGEGIEILAKERVKMRDGFQAAAVYHVGHEQGLTSDQARPMIENARRDLHRIGGPGARQKILGAAADETGYIQANSITSLGVVGVISSGMGNAGAGTRTGSIRAFSTIGFLGAGSVQGNASNPVVIAAAGPFQSQAGVFRASGDDSTEFVVGILPCRID